MTRINDTDNDSDNRFGSSVDAFVSAARTCPRTSARAPHSMAESRPPPPPGFPGHSPATSSSCIVALFRWYTCAAPPISNTRDRPDTNAPRLPSGACHSYEGTETAAKRASKVARGPLHERPPDSSKPTAAPRPPQTSHLRRRPMCLRGAEEIASGLVARAHPLHPVSRCDSTQLRQPAPGGSSILFIPTVRESLRCSGISFIPSPSTRLRPPAPGSPSSRKVGRGGYREAGEFWSCTQPGCGVGGPRRDRRQREALSAAERTPRTGPRRAGRPNT